MRGSIGAYVLICWAFFQQSVQALPPGMYYQPYCLTTGAGIHSDSLGGFGNLNRLRLRLNDKFLLAERDYRFNSDSTKIELAFTPRLGDGFCLDIVRSPLIENWNWSYYKLENIPVLSDSNVDQEAFKSPFSEAALEEEGNYKLNYGGNKSISLSVGEGGGLQLDQSLQLDLNGQISNNMFIRGHLSDQEIPIQPEGKSATLKEVDNIYVRVWGTGYSYTLGDYLFNFGERDVDAYIANVQGVNGYFSRGQYNAKAAYSRSRGKYRHLNFQGSYGRQTGYFLRGESGSEYITVLAGTEKIFRNGELLTRGKHYQIEYGEGRIDFTNNIIVSGEDNFTAEYQYTDQDYPTTLLSLQLSDSAGAFSWAMRGITEIEDKAQYSGGDFREEDLDNFSNVGNAEFARSSGIFNRDREMGWEEGLYFSESGKYVYVTQLDYDSLAAEGREMFRIGFSSDSEGMYRLQLNGVNQPYFVWDSTGGSFSPGELVPLPSRKSHVTFHLGYKLSDSLVAPVFSSLYFLGSQWDPNLYSNKSEGDNWDGGVLHNLGLNLGSPFNKGGLGGWKARSRIKYKKEDYKAFQQLEESYQFQEIWNVPSMYGNSGFYSLRFNLENEVFTGYKVGGDWGRFYSSEDVLKGMGSAESNRRKGYISWEKERERAEIFLEQKEAVENNLGKDNVKWGGYYQQSLGVFIPELSFARDSWESQTSSPVPSQLARNKLSLALPTHTLWDLFTLEPGGHVLKWESNYGQKEQLRDSLISWDVYQKFNLLNLGPWQSELFISFQNVQERNSLGSDYEESRYKLLEWNNRLQDLKKGISVLANYKINQTVEVPLLEVYQPVAEGTGTHVCDTISLDNRYYLDCREDMDKGDQKFLGLRRDSLSAGISIQELSFSGTLGWDPAKSLPGLTGFFADINLGLRYDISSKQDSAQNADFLPLFTDSQIDAALEGKNSLNPFLNWKNSKRNKSLEISYERQYFHSRLQYERREKLQRWRSQFNQDINDAWSYFVHGFTGINWRKSKEAGPSDSSFNFGGGGQLEYQFKKFWKALALFDYENSSGLIESNNLFEIQSVFPKIRLERELFQGGRAFSEYGIKYLWGSGEPNYRLSNYAKGRTQRFQTGMDFQLGQYVYASSNYLLRLEPDRDKLFQSLSAELRAIF